MIGAGTGGYAAAIRASRLGKTVAVVEKQQSLGGTCLIVADKKYDEAPGVHMIGARSTGLVAEAVAEAVHAVRGTAIHL